MQRYLIAAPQEEQEARACQIAHAAYRIGENSTLLRQNTLRAEGGLLLISDCGAPVIGETEALCAAVLRECGRRKYSGAVLDFQERPRGDLRRLAQTLDEALAEKKLTLYVPEAYADAVKHAMVTVGTALSGGTLAERLKEAAAKYPNRLTLDVERVRMDFSLPAHTGMGNPLTAAEFEELRKGTAIFYSQDLCARYFTYKRKGETRFVLFDDAETLRRKLQMGREVGVKAAFFVWKEVEDIADTLFA